ncbi:MAG TPA: OsmC family protein [Faecalibacter sp.]|uniref:OsmC family protein n=1 Tax=Faecalibacter sp. LW9 TaxID=3103144 RepID=UPI002AFFFE23|nr:OsmC family protein [Faecalibacter sp. LW9]
MSVNIKGVSSDEAFITQLETRGLSLIVDEPIDKGGKDTAMTPMELIGAALSSCTIITLQMYFNHKGWSYQSVEVDVDFDYTTLPTTFQRVVRVKGEFDEKQRGRIDKIANACPVHKLLEKGHTIETIVQVV